MKIKKLCLLDASRDGSMRRKVSSVQIQKVFMDYNYIRNNSY
jgi:hypothetical protein